MTAATPAHFTVESTRSPGQGEPGYFVIDVVNDLTGREAVAHLGNHYRREGKNELAKECFDLLDRTIPEVSRLSDLRYPKKGGAAKKDIARG